jgi:hypothetical protein
VYKGLLSTIKQYWTEYGGLSDFLRSPFTHFSLAATLLYALGFIEIEWRKIVMDSLPTVLGFSLAAYTITFTLMGSALHRALASAIDNTSGHSLLRIVNSTFFHVVVFQSFALIYALLSKGSLFHSLINWIVESPEVAAWINRKIVFLGDVLGCFLSVYAFFLLLSVGIAMFRLGRISPPAAVTRSANNDDEEEPHNTPSVMQTRRFRFVAWLSKRLGLYK